MTKENPSGFTPLLRRKCSENCARFGEPPCWRLPDLVDGCELITPCEECLHVEDDSRHLGETGLK